MAGHDYTVWDDEAISKSFDEVGDPLHRGDRVVAPAFKGTYQPGVVEGFCYSPAASRAVECEGYQSGLSDIWVIYLETSGHRRRLMLHGSWLRGPHPLERLASVAVE